MKSPLLVSMKNSAISWATFFLTVAFLTAMAAYTPLSNVNSWQPLTKDMWNTVVSNFSDHETRITNLATQVNGLATWTGVFGAYVAKSADTVYQAASDGFVIVNPSSCTYGYYSVYADSSTSPTTEITKGKTYTPGGTQAGATLPVKKNNYWKVTTTYWCAPDGITWMPIN